MGERFRTHSADKILHFQTCFHDKLQFIPQCLRELKKMRRRTIPSTRLKNPVFSNNWLHFQVSSISEMNSNDCTFRTTSTKGLPQILVTVISNMSYPTQSRIHSRYILCKNQYRYHVP